MHKIFLLLTISIFGWLQTLAQASSLKKLKKDIAETLAAEQGVFAVAFTDLQTGKTLYLHEHEIFHAASTMKTPVLVEAYKQVAAGSLSLADSLVITNRFQSIADTSHFSLQPEDDSEPGLYRRTGEKASLYDLLYLMIIRSSNLATNLVIDKLGAASTTATMRSIGAKDIRVLRGVEDGKAFDQGLNNVVSAFDLGLLFSKIAKGKIVNAEACQAMIKILLKQEFNDIIPARLPAGVKVAHKTGFFKGVHHDSGIVFLPDGRQYVLVLLSKDLVDDEAGISALAAVSAMVYRYMESR